MRISNPPPLQVSGSQSIIQDRDADDLWFQGYKPTAAKSTDEYAQLDAEDESLARWKASLGIVPGVGGDTSGPKARKPFKSM
jgi:RHO protein GDP dissociation inhibitor